MTGGAEFAVARELYAAFPADDEERIEAVLDPDAEWHNAQVSGRGSGVRLPGHFRHYLRVRDGRVVRLRWEVLPDHG